MSGFD